ncbi:MAG: hypothetical protein U0174_07445 [Polyangiaceae bacterium]
MHLSPLRKLSITGFLVSAALVAACGGKVIGLGQSETAVATLTMKCEQMFDAALAMANRCGEPAGQQRSAKAYNPSQRANYVRACVAQASAPGYDLGRLDACLTEVRTTDNCVDLAELEASFPPNFIFSNPVTLAECLAHPGSLDSGEACAYDSQCRSLHCIAGARTSGNPSYCGACADGDAAPRRSGLASIPRQKDQPCSSSCAEGFDCVSDTKDQSDTCQPRSPEGGHCGPVHCQTGLVCKSNTCIPAPVGGLGDDCSFGRSVSVQCDEDLSCESVEGEKRACVSMLSLFSQLGEPCEVKGKRGCDRMLWCDKGTCQPREAARCAN